MATSAIEAIDTTAVRNELRILEQLRAELKPPSGALFRTRMLVAMLADALDIIFLLIELGLLIPSAGLGSALAFALEVGLETICNAILFLTEFFVLDRWRNQLRDFAARLTGSVEKSELATEVGMALYERKVEGETLAGKLESSVKPGRERFARLRLGLNRLKSARFVIKRGWLMQVVQSLLDYIKFVDILPWRSVGVWRRHRKDKQNHQAIVEEFYPQVVANLNRTLALARALEE